MGEGGHRDDVSFNSNIRPKRSEDHDCDVPRARTERWAAHPEHVPAGLCSMTPFLVLVCVVFVSPTPHPRKTAARIEEGPHDDVQL